MAKYLFVVVVSMIALAGCQVAEPVSMVDHLPPPNFGGPANPNVVPPAAPEPPPAPLAMASPNQAPRPQPAYVAGVPRSWIPIAAANNWRWIVVHHSATPTGGAVAFDKMHRAKGWDELGYHFVIGNGTDTRDGQVEVGSRWPKQKWGAHAKTADNRYNEYGIGICLVGNFDVTRPTAAQMASLEKLVAYLMKTYRIAPQNILRHKDTKPTDCPGANLNIDLVRRACTRILAEAGDKPDLSFDRTETAELLNDVH